MDTPFIVSLFVDDVKCRNCGCKWTLHKAVSYTFEKVTRKIVNSDVRQKIKKANSDMEAKEMLIKESQNSIEELKCEKKKIEEIGSKFAYFLSANSTLVSSSF